MPTGWDSILTVISFGDCYTDGLEMLLLLSTTHHTSDPSTNMRVVS